ncbi:MAG: putative metal-binding motif-containing protein [Polyangiales bacterium]
MTPSLRSLPLLLILALGLGSGCSVIVNNKTQCKSSECDDGNACTTDYCGDGACQHDLIDEDGDGYAPSSCYAGDAGTSQGDCDDANSNVHPGAAEQCNGVDDNCNGQLEDGAPQVTCYKDNDKDGYHDATMMMTATCTCPDGYILPNAAGADCNDNNVQVHPGAPEQCNNFIDDNCNGQTDEASTLINCQRDADSDGFGDPNDVKSQCACEAGRIAPNPNGNDCADAVGIAYPGATTAAQTIPYCLGGTQTMLAVPDASQPTGYKCGTPGFTLRWDYDCDGAETQYWQGVNIDTSCYPPCSGMFCLYFCSDGWATATAPACGINGSFRDGTPGSNFFSCSSCSSYTRRQACK